MIYLGNGLYSDSGSSLAHYGVPGMKWDPKYRRTNVDWSNPASIAAYYARSSNGNQENEPPSRWDERNRNAAASRAARSVAGTVSNGYSSARNRMQIHSSPSANEIRGTRYINPRDVAIAKASSAVGSGVRTAFRDPRNNAAAINKSGVGSKKNLISENGRSNTVRPTLTRSGEKELTLRKQEVQRSGAHEVARRPEPKKPGVAGVNVNYPQAKDNPNRRIRAHESDKSDRGSAQSHERDYRDSQSRTVADSAYNKKHGTGSTPSDKHYYAPSTLTRTTNRLFDSGTKGKWTSGKSHSKWNANGKSGTGKKSGSKKGSNIVDDIKSGAKNAGKKIDAALDKVDKYSRMAKTAYGFEKYRVMNKKRFESKPYKGSDGKVHTDKSFKDLQDAYKRGDVSIKNVPGNVKRKAERAVVDAYVSGKKKINKAKKKFKNVLGD